MLKNHLRNQGVPIPEADFWIVAVERRGLVLTRDWHFEHLPQVRIGVEEG